MSFLLNFPDDLKFENWPLWINCKDFCLLDSAVCNKFDRPLFLRFMSDPRFVFTAVDIISHAEGGISFSYNNDSSQCDDTLVSVIKEGNFSIMIPRHGATLFYFSD
jgi:hypothetical protein